MSTQLTNEQNAEILKSISEYFAALPLGPSMGDVKAAWLEAIRMAEAALRAQGEPDGVDAERFVLWFFKECSQQQRDRLFEVFMFPVVEITSHSVERKVLSSVIKRIAKSAPQPQGEDHAG